MAKVEIYTTGLCPYCARAKRLLDRKGVRYVEHDVTSDPAGRQKMRERAGGRYTVPQVFVDGRHIGGSDELAELEAAGELDPLLVAAT
jgi:glutaredoxin 3